MGRPWIGLCWKEIESKQQMKNVRYTFGFEIKYHNSFSDYSKITRLQGEEIYLVIVIIVSFCKL